MKRCKDYLCDACVDGRCPIANSEEYKDCGMDIVNFCVDCTYYKGCKDCVLEGSDYCDPIFAFFN